MNVYKKIIRPLLFMLDGETAHNITKAVLRRPYLSWVLGGDSMFVRDERLQVQTGELGLSNPVGLAAGFDKDCEMLDSLERYTRMARQHHTGKEGDGFRASRTAHFRNQGGRTFDAK